MSGHQRCELCKLEVNGHTPCPRGECPIPTKVVRSIYGFPRFADARDITERRDPAPDNQPTGQTKKD